MAARLGAKGPRTPPKQWKRGLILGHSHIGDILYRTCSLPALGESLPDCEWSYLTTKSTAEVLSRNPHVSEVLPLIRGEDSWTLAPGALEKLKERGFDAVLCTNTLRHHADLLLATRLGIPNRVGYSGKGLSGLIDIPVELPFPGPYPAYFRAMVAAITERSPDWELRPRLYPSIDDAARAADIWTSFALGSKPVVACTLMTRQLHGNWPKEVLLAILEVARTKLEVDVVLCGAPDEKAELEQIASALSYRPHVLAGQVSLLAYAAFLGRCSALLALDSGPRHIGNAMGIPVVFARNLLHSKVEAGKYAPNEVDLAPPVEYLADNEVERIARAQPIDLLAAKLIEAISARQRPA